LKKPKVEITEVFEHSRSFHYSDGGYESATVGIEDLGVFVHDVAEDLIGDHHICGTLPL
jgi:hypothetical protein